MSDQTPMTPNGNEQTGERSSREQRQQAIDRMSELAAEMFSLMDPGVGVRLEFEIAPSIIVPNSQNKIIGRLIVFRPTLELTIKQKIVDH